MKVFIKIIEKMFVFFNFKPIFYKHFINVGLDRELRKTQTLIL